MIGGEHMICKTHADANKLGVKEINLSQLIRQLLDWQSQCNDDDWIDPVKIAMINSFEDIIYDCICEE